MGKGTWVFGCIASRAPISVSVFYAPTLPGTLVFYATYPRKWTRRPWHQWQDIYMLFSGCKGSVLCLEVKNRQAHEGRKKAESHAAPSDRACHSSREGWGGPRGTVTIHMNRFFWEFVYLDSFGKLAKWSFSKVGTRPVCAFVVSHCVEQSDVRERWFCARFHFSCDI